MSAALIDSNILMDLLDDGHWSRWSESVLAELTDEMALVINPIIFAEVSTRFSRMEDAEEFLSPELYVREDIPYSAAFLAGKAFLQYRRRGGTKTSPLSDFFIGAHAAVAGHIVVTRDPQRYRAYFPGLRLITPDA